MSTAPETRIPVTIVTGFLGSGKTTLINRILSEAHGRKIAVIENELGEADIDGAVLLEGRDGEIVEMMNGCICCTVRGDLVRILGRLARERKAGALAFDHVVIETTGVADPAPVAQTFFVEPECVDDYRLDAVVTLVDAKHGAAALDAERQARAQVGFADRLLISKTDLASEPDTRVLTERLSRMNARAGIARVEHGHTDVASLLDLRGFELDADRDLEALPLHAAHAHEDDIASFVVREARPYDLEKLEEFMGLLVDRYAPDMLRYKGILNIAGRAERLVFQGVHGLLGTEPGQSWRPGESRSSTLVFIGRGLPREFFEQGLTACVEHSSAEPAPA
ncbi:MAG TPA: GTP-binding protein [Burkholderiales bacterium]|nr:GTP-binding protein [Burkholderiales bacterium]